jgi:hypothetical protein
LINPTSPPDPGQYTTLLVLIFCIFQNGDMKRQETQNEMQNGTTPARGLRAATAVARDRGISDTTLWRWRARHWIKSVNICGKVFIDMESLAEFDRRAATGEFAQEPMGAAGESHHKLQTKGVK